MGRELPVTLASMTIDIEALESFSELATRLVVSLDSTLSLVGIDGGRCCSCAGPECDELE